MRKFFKIILLLIAVAGISGNYATANAQELQKRSQQDIRDMAKELTYTFDDITFTTEASIKKPYSAGEVSQESLKEALNAVNMVRYIAGLPADIILDDTYINYAQHAVVVNAANDELTHDPAQPTDMDNAFYNTGYYGTSHSNLGWGYPSYSITDSILDYMSDSDSSNIDRVGHRRWLLSPDMARIGFGFADNYTATYVMDYSRTEDIDYDYISWPSELMPMEYFSETDAWSVNLGDAYDIPSLETVEVTLTRLSDHEEWIFNKSSDISKQMNISGNNITSLSYGSYIELIDDYFNVDNGGYGMSKCIIFRPGSIEYTDGDQYEVKITGLKDSYGNLATLDYTVTFFAINELKSIELGTDSEELYIGDQIYFNVFYYPENTSSNRDIIWGSSNTKVAQVDKYGNITAIKKGTAVITAASILNKEIYSQCIVTVDDNSPPQLVKNIKVETASGNLIIRWDGVFNADSYEIQYATNSSFKNAKKITTESLTKTIKNLKKNQTYYVRIRAHKTFYGNGSVGKWSEIKKIKI